MIRNLYPEGPDPAKAQKNCKQLKLSKIKVNRLHKEPYPKLLKNIYDTLPLKGTCNTTSNSDGKSVLEQETGKQLNYGQLRKHPRLQETWNKSFSDEMGILCQGFGKGPNGKGKIIEVTNTFFVIKF